MGTASSSKYRCVDLTDPIYSAYTRYFIPLALDASKIVLLFIRRDYGSNGIETWYIDEYVAL